jgi:hypothetical protein
MHLLFVDESGTAPNPNTKGDRYFVIGGVIIPEGSWHPIKDALLGMKARLRVRGELKWRYFAPGNDDVANPMRRMSATERDDVRTELYSMLCSHSEIKAIACVASVEAAYKIASVKTREDLYQNTYKPVSERFQYYLQDASRNSSKQLGIVISDHRGARDDKALRLHHQKLLYSGSEFISRYENLVESLFIQPSNMSVGVQLADIVAGAVWRKFEKGDSRWFDRLTPAFRKSRDGTIEGYGLVRYPKDGWV